MSINNERGFTIIEIILFLAISGALFAALMIGVSTGIAQQRYSDSVRSYKALLEGQYAAALNTANEPATKYGCNTTSKSVDSNIRSSASLGTSPCVILGRAIQISNDGRQVTVSSVTGYEDPNVDVTNSSDDVAIQKYYPRVSYFDKKVIDLDWQSSLATQSKTYAILIIISPATGTLKTYFPPANTVIQDGTDLQPHISSPVPPSEKLSLCMSGDSRLLPKQIVTINATIAGANSVSVADSNTGRCS